MTATGARLAELNAQRIRSVSANSTVAPTIPTVSMSITTSSDEVMTPSTTTAPSLDTTSEDTATAGVQSPTTFSSPAADNPPASAMYTSAGVASTLSAEATVGAAVSTDAPCEDAPTTVYITVDASSNTSFSNTTPQASASEIATKSAVVSTDSVTALASLDTVLTTTTSPITTIVVLETTPTVPDEESAVTPDTSANDPITSAVSLTVPVSAAPASVSYSSSRPAVLDPELTQEADPHSFSATATATPIASSSVQPLPTSTEHPSPLTTASATATATHLAVHPISLNPGPITWGSLSSVAATALKHEDPHPNLARWVTIEDPVARTPSHQLSATNYQSNAKARSTASSLQSRHRHLASPLPLWLVASIFVALLVLVFWRVLADLIAWRRARCGRSGRSCGGDGWWWWWWGRTPRSGQRAKRRWSSREYGVGVESGTGYRNGDGVGDGRLSTLECGFVSGQHAGEMDPSYWPHERVGRESMP